MTPAGRPEIGSPVNVRLGEELLRQIDAWAADHEINRAEAIRRLVKQEFLRLEDDQ